MKFENDYLGLLQKRYRRRNPGRPIGQGDLVLINEKDPCPPNWKEAQMTEIFPDPEGSVRQVKLETASRDSVQRAVHQLVPLLLEKRPSNQETRSIANSCLSGPPSQPRTRAYVKAKGELLAQITIVLCLLLLLLISSAWSLDPVLKTRAVQVKVFDIKYTIATSMNLIEDLALIVR